MERESVFVVLLSDRGLRFAFDAATINRYTRYNAVADEKERNERVAARQRWNER